jgi:hypothetical protein
MQVAEEFSIHRPVFCHQMSQPPSSVVAVASASHHVRLIDLKSGLSTHELRGHAGEKPKLKRLTLIACLQEKLKYFFAFYADSM